MFKGYVINLDRHPERLHRFNQHPDAKFFQRLPAVDKKTLENIDPSGRMFFDMDLLKRHIERDGTLGEIACTLSHIKAWHLIANDDTLNDDDFAIIAEDDVILAPNFHQCITALRQALVQTPNIHLLILQRLFVSNKPPSQDIHELQILTHEKVQNFDDFGSALYMIKKSNANMLVQWLKKHKPYWLADHFSALNGKECIGMVYPLIGFVSDDAESDLENERQDARRKHGWNV